MKHIRLRLLVASAFTLLVAACSQVPTPQAQPDTQLTPQFGTKERENSSDIAVSTDLKAVFIAGNTFGSLDSTNAGSSDGYLRRYNRNGSLAWGVQFGGADEDHVDGLALDTRNRIYVAGDSRDHVTFVPHAFLKQYTASGKLAWHRDIDIDTPGNHNSVSSIATDTNDNVLVLGGGTPGGDNNDYAFINKYSSRGNIVWSKIYKNQGFHVVTTDRSGNIYMLDFDANVRKLSSSGRLIWDKNLRTAPNVRLYELRVVGDALYVTGSKSWEIDYNTPPETDAYIAKFNLAGNRIWDKSLGTKVPDEASGVTADSRGNVYLTGNTLGALKGKNAGEGDVFIAKYNPLGRLLWTQQFGSSDDDYIGSIAAFSPNELYVRGATFGNLGAGYRGGGDAFLARLDGEGGRVWTR